MNARELVLEILLELERGKTYSHVLIRSVLDKYDYLPAREKAFVKRLAEGTIERGLELAYVLDQFSKIPVRKMKPLIRCLLCMSAYQILYMDSVPDSAVCNEAVKLAAKRGFQNLKGFVNGVLRSLAREKEKIVYPDRQKEPEAHLSVRYSMPKGIVLPWLREYGFETTEDILKGLQEIHPVSIRFRSSLCEGERAEYLAAMERLGVKAAPSPYLDSLYLLQQAEGIHSLPGYEEGAFAVQDVSSALAVEAAGIREGDFVLDICAAPGGKSLYAAQKAGKVLSRDVSFVKLEQMEENRIRMGAQNMELQVWDARLPDESLWEKADVVLMDVPCSGLGVMGKKRDIKYHITEEGLKELEILQKTILENSWRYVKPGGVLLYSTCTIRREENEEMCGWICENFPFVPEDMSPFLPEVFAERSRGGMLQLLPGRDACDGFFMARLRRRMD